MPTKTSQTSLGIVLLQDSRASRTTCDTSRMYAYRFSFDSRLSCAHKDLAHISVYCSLFDLSCAQKDL